MQAYLFALVISMTGLTTTYAQEVVGTWKTVDDVTGKARSHVEIYKENGLVYGKIIKLVDPKEPNPICDKCKGDDKNEPVIGLVIIKGLEKDDDQYSGGKILDPENGKLYKCYISLEEPDKLKVRGYIGISLLGRTQHWYRVK